VQKKLAVISMANFLCECFDLRSVLAHLCEHFEDRPSQDQGDYAHGD
jgi:hypothetical protein